MKKKLIKEKKQIISAVIPDEIFQQLEKYAQKKERLNGNLSYILT